METIEQLVKHYDEGKLTRRHLIQALLALTVAPATVAAQTPPGPVFHGHTLNHVKIITADLNRSQRFYEALLGVKAGPSTATGLGGRHVDLPSGLGYLSLEPPRPGERTGVIEHVCVAVEENVSDVRAAVERAMPDVKVHIEKESGAVFFIDPDGAWVQIVRRPAAR